MAKEERDYWMPGDATFVHYGKAYKVGENLRTYCVGEIEDGKVVQGPPEQPPTLQKPILQQGGSSKPLPDTPPSIETDGIMQQNDNTQGKRPSKIKIEGGVKISKKVMQGKVKHRGRGRPIKTGKVHRATLWRRRQKAKQLELGITP